MAELPAHIANLLDRSARDAQGRPADSAGTPWEDRDLSGTGNPLHTFDGDDGLVAPRIAAAREMLRAGQTDEAGFVNELMGQRLFVPVIATGEGDAEHGDKQADISLVTLTSAEGRVAMPIFTSVEALTHWHAQARPVAAEAERIMLAALSEGAELVVLDAGAELTFVLRRPAVESLAQGSRWLPSYLDQQLARDCSELPSLCPGVVRLVLQPHEGIITTTSSGERVMGGGSGPELSIGVVLEPGLDSVDRRLALAAVQAAAQEVESLRRRADSLRIREVR